MRTVLVVVGNWLVVVGRGRWRIATSSSVPHSIVVLKIRHRRRVDVSGCTLGRMRIQKIPM